MSKPKKRKQNDAENEAMDVDEDVPDGGNAAGNNAVDVDEDMPELDHISDDEEGGKRIGDIYIPPPPKPALTFDVTGPRLIITHITNVNFKSYANEQILGPFHKCFTAIIGPNGSGKSNVIDSMLFVFGYRASKIRSKKISVLLHSSSKNPNVDSATVSVHFALIIDGEGDDYKIVPNSEMVVSRTAFKDNTSYYTLNGKRVQFKEVAKMLRSHGIDLDHNRFLILQGEVEQIAMMKPKGQTEHDTGMLEYLEDIVGTSRYKEPIEKVDEKVRELNESRREKLGRVRAADQDKNALQAPMEEAVDLINLANSIVKARNLQLQMYIHEGNKVVEKEVKMLDELKSVVAKIDEKLQKIQGELQEKLTILNTGTEQYNELRRQREEVVEKLQSKKRKLVSIQADITQGNKKKKNLDQLVGQEKGKLIELELIPDKNTREIEELERLLEVQTQKKQTAEEELQTVMAGVREQTRGFQEQKDRLQARLIDLKKNVDEANKDYKLAESELKIYLSNETKENEKLERMKEDYRKAEQDLVEKKGLQKQLSKSIPQQEKQLNEYQVQLEKYRTEESTVSREARSLRGELEESKETMSANRSRGRVLDSLMKEKTAGRLPGIFGRLGDLGGIDNRYDVAISTCCGTLDNIVVDNVETAQACVEFLKRNDIGRATFLALDKQSYLIEQYKIQNTYPENVPRLFDLIKVKDDRVLPAFYFALRDTLVATDLDQASRIAYGRTRYRVVTLKGDVIEIAGTMSGGGNAIMRGRMSSSVQQDTSEQDPSVLEAKERQLQSLESRLQEIRRDQSRIEDCLAPLQTSIREGSTTLKKLSIELKSLTEQVPHLKNQIQQQERRAAASKVDEAQKNRLEQVMSQSMERLELAKQRAGEVEKEVQGVDVQISEIAGGRVKDLRKAVDDLTKKINKVNTEKTKLRVAITTSVRNVGKAKEKITQMETDLQETTRNLESFASSKKELTLDIAELQKLSEELEERINEGTSGFKEIKEEINQLQKKEDKRKTERLGAANAVSKKEKSIEEYKARFPIWTRDLKSLKYEDPGIEGVPGFDKPDPLHTYSFEELEQVNLDELKKRTEALTARLGDKKPNIQVILDFKAKEELYLKRVAELEEITSKRNEMRSLCDELEKSRHDEFMAGFRTITAKLKEMYQMITLGGDAELELVDSLNPFSEGVIFSVRPPSKSWKNISNLSGGEKTLSSLALVFALHYYKPTPLYVMDEIDAALDFKNVSIVANYIKERTRNAQFIIISLRYNMFESSNRLVGIYKTEDCTQSVTVENALPKYTQANVLTNTDVNKINC